MDMFKVCLEEISLSGLEGCTLEELWTHLTDRQPPISFKLDIFTKSYLWNQVLASVTDTVDTCPVLLYQLPSPRELTQTVFYPGTTSYARIVSTRMEYKHPFTYRFVNAPSTSSSHPAVRGSCTSFFQRQDVTMEIASEEMSLSDSEAKYGNSLVLVASQELRERALIPCGTDPCVEIPDTQYSLLEVIGCSRHHGIPRPFVTSKYLKIDPRSTFFFVKRLNKRGLITIQNQRRVTSGNRTQELAILHLSNFSPREASVLTREEQFCSILSDSPHHCRPIKEMRELMGKQANATKSVLIKKGYVENVLMKDVAEEYANDPSVASLIGCRLLKPYGENKLVTEGECVDEEEDGETDSSNKVPIVTELTLEMQGYRLIDSCGPQGISQAEFLERTGLDLTRFTNRGIVKNLIRKSKVFAITQDSSAIRTISLVSADHVSKNKDYEKLQAEAAKSGMCNEDLPIATGMKFFPPDIRPPRREKMKYKSPFGGLYSSESAQSESAQNESNQNESTQKESTQKESFTDNQLADKDVPTPCSMQNADLDSSLDSIDSKLPTSDNSVPASPFQMTTARVAATQDLEIGSRKRSQPKLTYKQIKRTRNILEYFEQNKVIVKKKLFTLCKHLREVELKEGQEHVVDSKTVRKLISRLISENKIHTREVTLSVGSDDLLQTQTITLYHIPHTTEEEIDSIRERERRIFKAHVHRRALKLEPKTTKKPKKTRKLKNDFGLESSSEESEGEPPSDLVPIPLGAASYSKFQRLRHFHCYLWILAHGRMNHPILEPSGHTPPSPPVQIKKERGDAVPPSKEPGKVTFEEDNDDVYILAKTNYPWATGVNRLPRCSKGRGWLSFFDVIHNLPLSLLMILTRLSSGRVPSRFLCYFNDLLLMNTVLYDLPRELKKSVLQGERDINNVIQCLLYLEEMGLISIDGNMSRERSQVFIRLNTSATILDTSNCKPRRSFFLNSARPLFPVVSMTIECLADVERYWFELQSICLQTSIVLVEKCKTKHPEVDPEENDIHPLLYYASKHSRLLKATSTTKKYNKNGFGAGGLPPLFFSHGSRNWSRRINRPSTFGDELNETASTLSPMAPSTLSAPSTSGTHPGVLLLDLPHTDMGDWYSSSDEEVIDREAVNLDVEDQVDRTFRTRDHGGKFGTSMRGGDVEGSEQGPPAAKRRKVTKGVRASVPSSQVKKNDGGRGKERVRMKKVHKAVKAARKVISKQSHTHRYRLFNDISTYIEDDTLGRDNEEKVKDGPERAFWKSEQRNFILSSYLASVLLHHKGKPRTTYTQIRDELMKAFPMSKFKPISSVKRFLCVKLRKNPRLSSTLEIRLTECLQEMETMGEDSPELTLQGMLEFVIRRTESGKNMFSPEVLLPDTLRELHENYVVIGGSKNRAPCLPVLQDHEINQALITDLIIAALGADESSYDQYKAFKLFEAFPEVEVKAAFDRLKRELIIKSKRARKLGIPRKQSALETQAYAIAACFYTKLEGQFPPNLIHDATSFQSLLAQHRGQGVCDSTHLLSSADSSSMNTDTQEPGICWLEEEGHLKVSGDRAKATSVAALLEASCASSLENVTAVLPEPLYDETVNPNHRDMSDEEEEDEERISSLTSTQLLEDDLEGGDNSDGEEKEEEEDGKRTSIFTKEMIRKKLHYGTGGVSTLFGVGAGGMRYGFVELDPALSRGKLLECVPHRDDGTCGGQNEESCSRYKSYLTTNQPGCSEAAATSTSPRCEQMSIDVYVTICEEHLKYADSDILFTRQLYQVINDSGSNGVQRSSLDGHMALCHLHCTLSLEEHIHFLINFEMVCVVGVTEDILVTSGNSGRWHMVVGDVIPHQPLTPYRPWSAIDSSDPNMSLLEKYRCGVLTHVMAHPGVTLAQLAEHFSVTLQLNGLRDILQVLETSNQVRCFRVPSSKQCVLFENATEGNEGVHYMEYYEATLLQTN